MAKKTVFSIFQTSPNAGGIYYSNSDFDGGTKPERAGEFIRDSFSQYGYSVGIYGPYDCTIWDINNATTADRLMYLDLHNYIPYGDHAAIGFAWNAVARQSDGETKYFLKVADGINAGGRYLDVSRLGYDRYIEIKF